MSFASHNIAPFPVFLEKVIDGDTVKVSRQLPGCPKDNFTVRLAYIDSPEKKQNFGEIAKQQLESKILRSVTIYNPLRLQIVAERDRYNRKLGVLLVGQQESLNLWLVEEGLAWAYTVGKCPQNYKDAQERAQRASKGLWNKAKPQAPWIYRKVRAAATSTSTKVVAQSSSKSKGKSTGRTIQVRTAKTAVTVSKGKARAKASKATTSTAKSRASSSSSGTDSGNTGEWKLVKREMPQRCVIS